MSGSGPDSPGTTKTSDLTICETDVPSVAAGDPVVLRSVDERNDLATLDHLVQQRATDDQVAGGVASLGAAQMLLRKRRPVRAEQCNGCTGRVQQPDDLVEDEVEQVVHRPVLEESQGQRGEDAGGQFRTAGVAFVIEADGQTGSQRVAVNGHKLRGGLALMKHYLGVAEGDAVTAGQRQLPRDARTIEHRAVDAPAVAHVPLPFDGHDLGVAAGEKPVTDGHGTLGRTAERHHRISQ